MYMIKKIYYIIFILAIIMAIALYFSKAVSIYEEQDDEYKRQNNTKPFTPITSPGALL